MAKKAKGGGKKPPAAGKAGRKKFTAPTNTKTGKSGDAALSGKEQPFIAPERMTPGTFLKSLLAECRGFKKNVDSIVGSMRERIAYGKDKKNLNTGVFGWLRKIDNMEPEKAAEWHHTYIHYLNSSGLMAKIDSVERLPLDDKPQTAGEGAEEDEGDGEAAEAAAETIKPSDAASLDAHKPNGAHAGEATGAKVSRPQFGAPRSQSEKAADVVAAAGGKPH